MISSKLRHELSEILEDLAILGTSDGRQAFLASLNFPKRLINLINIDKPLSIFIPILIDTAVKYGDLENGTSAVLELLLGSKAYVGEDKLKKIDAIIDQMHSQDAGSIAKPAVMPINDTGVSEMKDSSALRQELTEKFDDVEFEAFCQDNFPDVHDKFGRGLRKDEQISLLLDYCQRKRQTDALISLLRVGTSNAINQTNMISDENSQNSKQVKVFINHASEDKPLVRKLYAMLKTESWLDPWLDEVKLLPGQDWEHEIDKAIKEADAVIICLSKTSLTKIGVVQAEIHKAEEMQERRPHGYIYMIPVLLEKCQVPDNLAKYHWVDVFAPGKIDLVIRSLQTLRSLKRD